VLPTDAGSPASAGPEGPVPYQRFSEVNKQKNAYEQELKALAWAKDLDQQALLRSVQRFSTRFTAKPRRRCKRKFVPSSCRRQRAPRRLAMQSLNPTSKPIPASPSIPPVSKRSVNSGSSAR
jgi:hypothetical protein